MCPFCKTKDALIRSGYTEPRLILYGDRAPDVLVQVKYRHNNCPAAKDGKSTRWINSGHPLFLA
jgi:hypothetical protein